MNIHIDKSNRLPIRDQIKDQIKGLVHAGLLRGGDQLPTIRLLSIDLAVNFNTVAQAYHELTSEGIIETARGKGTFVAKRPGDEEIELMRVQKLRSLVALLFEETHRLGYTDNEVMLSATEYCRSQSKAG